MSESEYREGDLVEAVKGEVASSTRFRGVLALVENANHVKGLVLKAQGYEPMMQWLEDRGFEFTVIERAKPALPTAIGSVIRIRREPASTGWIYELSQHGYWWGTDHQKYTPTDLDGILRSYGPSFDVLAPVAETAKKLLDALGEYLDGQVTGRTKNDIIGYLAAEFGVQS